MATLARPGKSPPRSVRAPLSGIGPGFISAAIGLGLGLLALGPGLQRGFLLSYDMVFVPREPFAAALPGLASGSSSASGRCCSATRACPGYSGPCSPPIWTPAAASAGWPWPSCLPSWADTPPSRLRR